MTLRAGEKSERIDARTVIWAAGVRASPLAERIAAATGATLDSASASGFIRPQER